MTSILVITGNCGVGKSTIARAWADARNGASIHCDDMHLWIRVREIRHSRDFQEAWKTRVSITAAIGLAEQGLDVAIDNVWKPAACIELKDVLSKAADVKFVRLACDRQQNHERDQRRTGGAVMGPRVDTLGDELNALAWPDFVRTINSTGLSVEQTLSVIAKTP